MNAVNEQALLTKLKRLSPQQVAEVGILWNSSRPNLPARGTGSIADHCTKGGSGGDGTDEGKEEEIPAEVKAARTERRAQQHTPSGN